MNSKWLDRFSYKFRKFGISNLMLYITGSMLILFVAEYYMGFPATQYMHFNSYLIGKGELWRLITFVLLPNSLNDYRISTIGWFFIMLMLYYSIGTELEQKWGTAVFNLYYLIGVVGTIIGGLFTGYTVNSYLNLSLLLAYAIEYPEAEFRIFFLLPVKAKYVGIATAVLYVYQIIQAMSVGLWSIVFAQIISIINLLLFFGPTMWNTLKRNRRNKKRRKEFQRGMNQRWDKDEKN